VHGENCPHVKHSKTQMPRPALFLLIGLVLYLLIDIVLTGFEVDTLMSASVADEQKTSRMVAIISSTVKPIAF
jgi:hypothetical protein